MNLQICFMNETASDTESPSSDSETCPKLSKSTSNASSLSHSSHGSSNNNQSRYGGQSTHSNNNNNDIRSSHSSSSLNSSHHQQQQNQSHSPYNSHPLSVNTLTSDNRLVTTTANGKFNIQSSNHPSAELYLRLTRHR